MDFRVLKVHKKYWPKRADLKATGGGVGTMGAGAGRAKTERAGKRKLCDRSKGVGSAASAAGWCKTNNLFEKWGKTIDSNS